MKKHALMLAFGLSVIPLLSPAATIWTETFTYPDGSLTNVSEPLWTTHSGTGTPIVVTNGVVTGMSAGSGSREDSNRLLDTSYSSGVLYAGFDLTLALTAAPVSSAYFAHFKDATTSGFRGRVFIGAPTTSGFRLGLENDAGDNGASVIFTGDLSLGTTYRVVLAYDTGAGTSSLWVNNSDVDSPDLEDTTPATLLTITSFALRQGATAPGAYTGLNLDNLILATDFASAVPEPSSAAFATLAGIASLLIVRRKR